MIIGSEQMWELGIHPEQSSFIFYDLAAWKDRFQSEQEGNIFEGRFEPRILTAHINSESRFVNLNLLHEYHGHGSFCEHASIGKQIVSYHQELYGLEQEIKKSNGEESIILRSHPLFQDYAKLKEESDRFFESHHNRYEGFAYWLESYLAQENGLGRLFELKERHIDDIYLKLIGECEYIVYRNSEKDLVDKIFER